MNALAVKKKPLVGLISSVTLENKTLVKKLGLKKNRIAGLQHCYTGSFSGRDIVCITSGVGKTNAAHAATVLIQKFMPGVMITFGVGGAYPSSGLQVGDVAVADKEVYGDEGVLLKSGFRGTDHMGIPLLTKGSRKYFNEFRLDRKYVKKAVQAARFTSDHSSYITRVKAGPFVTVSACTGSRKKALELQKKYNAVCENMEGAAVAHICALYGKPMVEVRGISNIVEDRDKTKWDLVLAAENCQHVVLGLLKSL